MDIILGSKSPRRESILKIILDKFNIVHPDINEKQISSENPITYSMRISEEKSNFILSNLERRCSPTLVITSDTIVTVDDFILGKPSDFDDAINTLSILNGKVHKVISSITLLYLTNMKNNSVQIITDYEISEIKFKSLNMSEITEYLNSIDYTDKAGAYAIQENGEMIIEKFTGSLSNIIGFPLRLFFSLASENGLIEQIFKI